MLEFGIQHLHEAIQKIVNVDSKKYGISRRGIFYKVVSMGFYPSTGKEYYGKLGDALEGLRHIGEVNEDNILDSTRIRAAPNVYSSPKEYLEAIKYGYRRDYWKNQPIHLEVFCEKDALSTVLTSSL